MKRQFFISVLLISGAFACHAISIDQSVLNETFDSDALGVLTTAGGWSVVDPSSLKNSRKIEVLLDSGDLMGNGTSNQILFFQDIASDPVTYDVFFTANGLSTGKVLMVSFDFYEPSSIPGGLHMAVGGGNAAANPVNAIILADGSISPSGSYTLNAAHHLDVAFNETGDALDYDDPAGGTSTLASGLMDIWIDQVRVAAGVTLGRDGSPGSSRKCVSQVPSRCQMR